MNRIIYSTGRCYIESIQGHYHVFVGGITHAICDSAYKYFDLAKSRCDYLHAKNARSQDYRYVSTTR